MRSLPIATLLAVAIAACASPSATPGSTAPTATVTPPAATSAVAVPSPSDRVSGWRADLAALIPGMARLHPALDHGTPRPELDAAVAALSAKATTSDDDQMLVGLMRIVALVSARGCDAHTGAYVWGGQTYTVDSLPLHLWWFDEGVVVVDALAPYRDLIGWRIDSLSGKPIRDATAAIDPLIPRDNDMTVRLLMPRFLIIPQVLRGLGLAGAGPVALGLSRGTERRDVAVTAVPMREYNAWAGQYGLHLPADPAALWLSRMNDALWWRSLDDGTLYVQYDRVDFMSGATLDELRTALRAPGVSRVVVDVRLNTGGEVSAVTPMVELFKDPAVDRAGRLFVITGRNSFSATALFVSRLDATTTAIVTGEPMSGCPTAYGNARTLTLPYTGINVSVSTLLEIGVSAGDTRPTIEPELPARLTLAAWQAHEDPALAGARAFRQ